MPMKPIFAAALLLTNSALLTTTQRAEIKRIEERLLAPCCYSQSIAQHMSVAAEQMRDEVTEMVAEGRGESKIIDHYKGLYGERILIVPDGATGKVLFAMPVLAFLLSSTVLWLFLRRTLRPAADPCVGVTKREGLLLSDTLRDRIDRETGEDF